MVGIRDTFLTCRLCLGSGASRVKTGVQYAASWLAPLGFSIVDQISEAAMIDSKGSRNCEERFKTCQQISLKETVAEKSEEVRLSLIL